MKLAVLGASGGCGRLLVKEALDRGHEVTAVVRPSSKVTVPVAVRVQRGALDDASFLAQALRGCDAVLSGVGLRVDGLSPFAHVEDPGFLRRHSAALVDAMRNRVHRLVALSSGGVGESYDWLPATFKALIKTSSLRKQYPELFAMEQTFLSADLDVCVVRPTLFTDDKKTGKVRVVTQVKGRATIPRADVAAFMLEALERRGFSHQTPMITVVG